ncbi:hypothetical protein OTU49_004709, partial [Cherax quadricarinatus]
MDQQSTSEDEKVPAWPDEPLTDPLADPLGLDDGPQEQPEPDCSSRTHGEDGHSSNHPSDNALDRVDRVSPHANVEAAPQEMITVDDVRFSENSCDSEKVDEDQSVKDGCSRDGHGEQLMENECVDFCESDIGADSARTPPPDSHRDDSEGRNEDGSRPGSKAESSCENNDVSSPLRAEENSADSNYDGGGGGENSDSGKCKSEKVAESHDGSQDGGMDSDRERLGGSDAGDDDTDNKTRRLRAKRRHISGSSDVIAPPPKIKRKCRKNISDDDEEWDRDRERRRRDDSKSSDDEGDDSDSDEDSRRRKIRRRSGAVTGLSAKPKVKNLRRNIRDIISDDKLEDDTLTAQKEEQLRLQRLQEKRVALREYLEQQQ